MGMNSVRATKSAKTEINRERIVEQDKSENLDKLKDFTNELMATKNGVNGHKNGIDNDDLLKDLFGDIRHETNSKENENTTITSRASALMDTIPDLTNDDAVRDDDKWPWQQKLDAL